MQDVHIIEGRNEYKPNDDIALGSAKWLSLYRYHQTESCLETLRTRDCRIVATSPHADGYDLTTLPLDRPVALLFGTEEQGLSDLALEAADATLRLPMYGFTESYNISVTVAICLSRLVERIRESDSDWHLTEEEQQELTLEFYRRIVKRHDLLEEKFWGGTEGLMPTHPEDEQPELPPVRDRGRETFRSGFKRFRFPHIRPAGLDRCSPLWWEHLLTDIDEETILDLSDRLIIVPTRHAGRRLREALALAAGERDAAVFPPLVVTQDYLVAPERVPGDRPVADRETTRLVWAALLLEIDLERFRRVSSRRPDRS